MYSNNVTVVGNATGNPRLYQGNGKVADFSVAVNKRTSAGNDETKEITDFIEVECWGSLAEHVAESLGKGSRVVVTGSLRQNRWTDSEDNKRSTIRIRATAVGLSLEFSSCKALEKEA